MRTAWDAAMAAAPVDAFLIYGLKYNYPSAGRIPFTLATISPDLKALIEGNIFTLPRKPDYVVPGFCDVGSQVTIRRWWVSLAAAWAGITCEGGTVPSPSPPPELSEIYIAVTYNECTGRWTVGLSQSGGEGYSTIGTWLSGGAGPCVAEHPFWWTSDLLACGYGDEYPDGPLPVGTVPLGGIQAPPAGKWRQNHPQNLTCEEPETSIAIETHIACIQYKDGGCCVIPPPGVEVSDPSLGGPAIAAGTYVFKYRASRGALGATGGDADVFFYRHSSGQVLAMVALCDEEDGIDVPDSCGGSFSQTTKIQWYARSTLDCTGSGGFFSKPVYEPITVPDLFVCGQYIFDGGNARIAWDNNYSASWASSILPAACDYEEVKPMLATPCPGTDGAPVVVLMPADWEDGDKAFGTLGAVEGCWTLTDTDLDLAACIDASSLVPVSGCDDPSCPGLPEYSYTLTPCEWTESAGGDFKTTDIIAPGATIRTTLPGDAAEGCFIVSETTGATVDLPAYTIMGDCTDEACPQEPPPPSAFCVNVSYCPDFTSTSQFCSSEAPDVGTFWSGNGNPFRVDSVGTTTADCGGGECGGGLYESPNPWLFYGEEEIEECP